MVKKYIVEICIGTSCHLMGAQNLIDAVRSLPKEILEQVQLKTATCLKSCGNSPAVRINGQIYSPMTPAELVRILSS